MRYIKELRYHSNANNEINQPRHMTLILFAGKSKQSLAKVNHKAIQKN